jgi:hypothetical protein
VKNKKQGKIKCRENFESYIRTKILKINKKECH